MSGTAQTPQEFEADRTADGELIVRMASTHRAVDDPLRAMYEALVIAKVLTHLREAVELDAMPEAAATPSPEQPIPNDARDRAIRCSIVCQL